MWKACSRCGKIHRQGSECPKRYVMQDTQERALRNRYAWATKSKQIRDEANYLCEVCRDEGVLTYENVEVHHIVKLKDNRDLLLDDDNLICLCQRHHKDADAGKIPQEYLQELARRRRKDPPIPEAN